MSIPRPTERPSFAQRDAYREALSDGYAQGRLEDAEFRRRLDAAAEATVLSDLEELIADLPRGDLPVPAAQIRGPERREAEAATRTSTARRGLAIAASVLVGGLVGFLGGSVALFSSADDSDQDTAGTDGTAAHGERAGGPGDRMPHHGRHAPGAGAGGHSGALDTEVSYADIQRALDLAADQDELSALVITDSDGVASVPTAAGTTYDLVTVDEDGNVMQKPGGTYGDGESDVRVDSGALDADALLAMALAAPEVFTDTLGESALPAGRIEIRTPDREYAGLSPDAPVVRVELALDEYGQGGGAVLWTLDGDRVLEVLP